MSLNYHELRIKYFETDEGKELMKLALDRKITCEEFDERLYKVTLGAISYLSTTASKDQTEQDFYTKYAKNKITKP